MTIALKNKTEFKFGDYAIIEQKRHGVPNEMFVHKVIDQLRSNTWVDVPVQSPATETMHDEMEDVCLCICCGVDETEVRRYRVKDMRHRPPVSAVTDEKKDSTISLQAVNELIASLEGAGELSIKETKVMALAKAFKQLAAENYLLKSAHPQPFGPEMMKALDAYEKQQDEVPETGMLDAFFILRESIRIKTP
ncbi:hypothetical protein RRQ98_001663, partial [Klebsiella pneumoniae]|nr:hypothetical protein [Klebsiella pneumoniae]